jgi:hypothetical protein
MARQNSRANVRPICLLLPRFNSRVCIFSKRCDAEPGALADYILALLKHNVPESEMRKELLSQLEEFLEKGTRRCQRPIWFSC